MIFETIETILHLFCGLFSLAKYEYENCYPNTVLFIKKNDKNFETKRL
jgi:hypothetical protein